MTHRLTEKGIETTFTPERDLFRLLTYGTYDLLELNDLIDSTHGDPEIDPNDIIPHSILTDEEQDLIHEWYVEYADTMSIDDAIDHMK
jgi:hypothetical protein